MGKRKPPLRLVKLGWDMRLIRMFGFSGSRGARKQVAQEYRETKALAKRGHKIRKAHQRKGRR